MTDFFLLFFFLEIKIGQGPFIQRIKDNLIDLILALINQILNW